MVQTPADTMATCQRGVQSSDFAPSLSHGRHGPRRLPWQLRGPRKGLTTTMTFGRSFPIDAMPVTARTKRNAKPACASIPSSGPCMS